MKSLESYFWHHIYSFKKNVYLWGAWVAQSVEHQTSAQVMIPWLTSLSPASGAMLTAQSLEPASGSVSPSLSAPPRSCCVSHCLKNKYKHLKNYLKKCLLILGKRVHTHLSWGRAERENPKQALCCQCRARPGARSHKPWDHGLSQNQELDA